jgi:hypothetical protein
VTISKTVLNALNQADGYLCTALAYAVQEEEKWVVEHINNLLMDLREIPQLDTLFINYEEIKGPNES